MFFSNARNWITLLDRIIARQLPVDTYIPGHGPVHIGRGVADLEEQRRYFVVMRDEVSKMIMAGKTVEQVQKEFKMPQEFAHYQGPQPSARSSTCSITSSSSAASGREVAGGQNAAQLGAAHARLCPSDRWMPDALGCWRGPAPAPLRAGLADPRGPHRVAVRRRRLVRHGRARDRRKPRAKFGQQFVLENRGGAGGLIGSAQVASAPPDGYTFLISSIGTHVIAPLTSAKAGYDPVTSFTNVAYVGGPPIVIVVHPSLGVKSLRSWWRC